MKTLIMKVTPKRAAHWQLRTQVLRFGRLPAIMGIVNVTPDSFSDGGQHASTRNAVEHGLRLISEGADILDIGGESTRPYAEQVTADDELDRVLHVVQQLAERTTTPVSIDTSKASVARACLAAGAEIINDVTGLQGDPDMAGLAVETDAGICAMHMQGTPQTMQDNPSYQDVVADVFDYLRRRRDALVQSGIAAQRVCLDPGIGFGKTNQHSLTLLSQCGRFHELGCPLLVGHSRKGLLGSVLGDKQADRTAATIGVALSLAQKGIQIIRVHDVQPVRDALQLFEATGGITGDL